LLGGGGKSTHQRQPTKYEQVSHFAGNWNFRNFDLS
jgi:hypothetical protein